MWTYSNRPLHNKHVVQISFSFFSFPFRNNKSAARVWMNDKLIRMRHARCHRPTSYTHSLTLFNRIMGNGWIFFGRRETVLLNHKQDALMSNLFIMHWVDFVLVVMLEFRNIHLFRTHSLTHSHIHACIIMCSGEREGRQWFISHNFQRIVWYRVVCSRVRQLHANLC